MVKKKPKKEKITNESLLSKMKFDFSRDAEWFKRTTQKISEIKEELDKNFYDETKKKQKIDFIHKLQNKLKDYKDAIKFESRYKKVRFIERRKLERKLKKINKMIGGGDKNSENLQKLEKERQNIIDDINYVKFYPKTYKYYSLFPNKDSDNEEMIKKREKMKEKIKFFLNGKKNKKMKNTKEESEQENKSDNNYEDKDDDEDGEKNEKNVEGEEKIEKIEKKEKKEKKEQKIKENEIHHDYEYVKNKKVFKDDFFELDE